MTGLHERDHLPFGCEVLLFFHGFALSLIRVSRPFPLHIYIVPLFLPGFMHTLWWLREHQAFDHHHPPGVLLSEAQLAR